MFDHVPLYAAAAVAASSSTGISPSATSSSAMPSSSAHHPPTSSPPGEMPLWHFRPGRESWVAITLVVLSLTLSHTVQRIQARRALRKRQRSRDQTLEPSSRRTGTLFRAINARANTFLYLYIIPPWLYAPETASDAIWTGVYCIMMLFCAAWRCPLSRSEYPYLFLANRFGVLAYAQTPLIFLLAVKNNPLSPITGITYQKLNYLHRASARACITFAWLHALLWLLPVLIAGHWNHWYIVWGTVALISFTGLWATSVRSLRRKSFEFFLVTHILFSVAFILGAILHWPLKAYWIWPALAIWTLDRLIRIARVVYINKIHKTRRGGAVVDDCRVEVVSRDVMRVTIVRQGLKWEAGQHFFLSSPATGGSVHESHPFSIANMPNAEGEVVFLIRSHNGFTRRLLDLAPTSPPLLLEGSYGHSHTLTHYTSLLLVSGGTGVTFTLSHLLSLISYIRAGRSIARRIKMVWHVRHAEDISWITPLLDDALSDDTPLVGERGERGEVRKSLKELGVKLEVEVWVTRSKSSAEPWELGQMETVPSTPIWTRPPSPSEGIDRGGASLVNSQDRGPRECQRRGKIDCGRCWDGGGCCSSAVPGAGVSTPPSSSGSSVMVERETRVERAEVNEMTRLIPSLGRTGSSISILPLGAGRGGSGTSTPTRNPIWALRNNHSPPRSSPLAQTPSSPLLPTHSPAPAPAIPIPHLARPTLSVNSSGITYISHQTQRVMSLHPGRADLLSTISTLSDEVAEDGRMIVVACGPVALMNDTRGAVGRVNSWGRIRGGRREVEFLEETVGH